MMDLADGLERLFIFTPIIMFVILLSALDYITTKKVLKAGGAEVNRFIKWCIEKKIFTPCKIALTFIVVAIIWRYGPRHPVLIAFTGGYVCGGYTFVVWNNVRQLCILKRNLK